MKINKNQAKNIFLAIAGVCIILYFVYQVVQMNSNPYKTELALERDIKNTVSTKAFNAASAPFFVSPVFAAIAAIKSDLFI